MSQNPSWSQYLNSLKEDPTSSRIHVKVTTAPQQFHHTATFANTNPKYWPPSPPPTPPTMNTTKTPDGGSLFDPTSGAIHAFASSYCCW